jgi:hypothetical protein
VTLEELNCLERERRKVKRKELSARLDEAKRFLMFVSSPIDKTAIEERIREIRRLQREEWAKSNISVRGLCYDF